MLVLLEDVRFTVYHAFYRIREIIGNCARVRSEICCTGRLQVRTYSQSPLGPKKRTERNNNTGNVLYV